MFTFDDVLAEFELLSSRFKGLSGLLIGLSADFRKEAYLPHIKTYYAYVYERKEAERNVPTVESMEMFSQLGVALDVEMTAFSDMMMKAEILMEYDETGLIPIEHLPVLLNTTEEIFESSFGMGDLYCVCGVKDVEDVFVIPEFSPILKDKPIFKRVNPDTITSITEEED
jgi:hypothetical protein